MPAPEDTTTDRRHRVRNHAGHGPRRGKRGEFRAKRHWASRALHRLEELSSHAGAGVLVVVAVLAWLIVGLAASFPTWWQAALFSAGSSLTLVMVFAIQHTQARQESAIQRKLDEIVRSLPDADDGLIAAEEAPDEELAALADLNVEDRERSGS